MFRRGDGKKRVGREGQTLTRWTMKSSPRTVGMRTWLVLGNGPMTARELEIIGILPVDCGSETKP